MTRNKFDIKILDKLNFHQDVKLLDAINSMNQNNIDPKNIPIGMLSKISMSEFSFINDFTIDDIFLYIITFLNIIIIICSNKYIIENSIYKCSNETKQKILDINKYINIILGIILIIYAIYMYRMLYVNKNYMLVNRKNYIFIYLVTAISIFLTSINLNRYIIDRFKNIFN
jgi:hypothetical protein